MANRRVHEAPLSEWAKLTTELFINWAEKRKLRVEGESEVRVFGQRKRNRAGWSRHSQSSAVARGVQWPPQLTASVEQTLSSELFTAARFLHSLCTAPCSASLEPECKRRHSSSIFQEFVCWTVYEELFRNTSSRASFLKWTKLNSLSLLKSARRRRSH